MTTKKAKPPAQFHITNCNFDGGKVDPSVVAAVVSLAEAASENARAIKAAAEMLKAPDALLKIQH